MPKHAKFCERFCPDHGARCTRPKDHVYPFHQAGGCSFTDDIALTREQADMLIGARPGGRVSLAIAKTLRRVLRVP